MKPVPFLAYADYKKSYGTTAALKLVQSEYDNMQLTAELVEVRRNHSPEVECVDTDSQAHAARCYRC